MEIIGHNLLGIEISVNCSENTVLAKKMILKYTLDNFYVKVPCPFLEINISIFVFLYFYRNQYFDYKSILISNSSISVFLVIPTSKF